MSWTEERIATLKKLWEGGATASQIAEELGGVSRNAVIGKAHRLELKARPSPVKANESKAKAKAEPAAELVPAKEQPAGKVSVSEAPVTSPAAVPALELSRKTKASPREDAQRQTADEERSAPWSDRSAEEVAVTAQDGSKTADDDDIAQEEEVETTQAASPVATPRIVSVGPGGFLRQGPGDQQPPIPPAPPRRLVPAKPSPEIADKTSLLELNDKVCRWPMGHPGEPDFHFCGEVVNPGFPYCVQHCGRAYQAQLPRGARRPPPPLPFGGPRVR